MVRALGTLKKAAALANAELGELPQDIADLIARAADEVIELTTISRWLSSKPVRALNPI